MGVRGEIRAVFEHALKLTRQYGECSAYLYENQEDPDWNDLDEKTKEIGNRLGTARYELAETCGVEEWEASKILTEVSA